MLRTLLTALLVIWLLAGCSSSEELDSESTSPKDAYLGFCPEVVHQIGLYHQGFDRLVESDDEAHLRQVRTAALRMSALSEMASRRVSGPEAVEGEWLRDLGYSAQVFYTVTDRTHTPEEVTAAFNALSFSVSRAESWCSELAL